jgi:hypothetical protein
MAETTQPICSGRGCGKPSIGMVQDSLEVPRWRRESERSCAFKFLEEVFYCADHEEAAKSTRILVSSSQVSLRQALVKLSHGVIDFYALVDLAPLNRASR